MKLYYSLLSSFAVSSIIAASAQELRGGHQRRTASAYPECDDRYPTVEQLLTTFANGQEAYDYCIGECQNSEDFCLDWNRVTGCDDPMPSQASLAKDFKDADEAYGICYYECNHRSEEFCMNWKNNYPTPSGPLYPECDDRYPPVEQLLTTFANGQEAYAYCIGECQNSEDFCLDWNRVTGCDDPMPSQASLAKDFKDADEAYGICYYECNHRSEEFCMNWKNNYPTPVTTQQKTWDKCMFNDYVRLDICNWHHWSEIAEVCNLYGQLDEPSIEFLIESVKAGQCTDVNWNNMMDHIIHQVHGGHQRRTAVAYPECDDRYPPVEQLLTTFANGQEAYDYCIGECQNSEDFCLDWNRVTGCDDPMPSQASLAKDFKDADEAYGICYYECNHRSEEFCMNWKNNYPTPSGPLYPECDDRYPPVEQLLTTFANGQEAYEYCIGECQNSEDFCLDWNRVTGCDDPMPSQASLAKDFKDADEAYGICYYECNHRSEEFCMNWKNNYPTPVTTHEKTWDECMFNDYVRLDICDWHHWSEIAEVCNLYGQLDEPSIEFLIENVKAGQCTDVNWYNMMDHIIQNNP